MNQTLSPFMYNNFLNQSFQKDQNLNTPLGFTFCPTISNFSFMSNSDKIDSQSIASSEDSTRTDESQLRTRLLEIFRKDKKKYHGICDKFIDLMGLEAICSNIRAMGDFITKTALNHTTSNFTGKKNFNQTMANHSFESDRKKNPLMIFSTQAGFLSTIFSRDKITVLLQVHTSYQKIQNFLNFLCVSLESFTFTNQKEWILMKDEIERYLLKYEKNINTMLEVAEDEIKCDGMSKTGVKPKKDKVSKKILRSGDEKELRYLLKQKKIHLKIQEELNLQQYKIDLFTIKQKIKQVQMSMCMAIRNSFSVWYKKFEGILQSLRQDFSLVCLLIQKAKKFDQSTEKYQIIDFLLVTRLKGMETIVFLEQVYKCILVKLEDSRLQLSYSVISAKSTRMRFNEKDKIDFVMKQQGAKESIENTFRKFEKMLNVSADRKLFGWNKNLIIFQDSESQMISNNEENEKEKEKENEQKNTNVDFNEISKNIEKLNQVEKSKNAQKGIVKSKESEDQEVVEEKLQRSKQKRGQKIRKNKREDKKEHRKESNIILQSPLRKKLQQESKKSEENKLTEPCFINEDQKMAPELQQKDSSSLQFLMDQINSAANIPASPKLPQKVFKKIVFNSSNNQNAQQEKQYNSSYQEIESLSIESQIEINFRNGDLNSEDFVLFERNFNEEELEKIERQQMMDDEDIQ